MGYQLTSKERAFLSSLASKEHAVLHIGKDGVSPETTNAVNEALNARELVKINLQKNCVLDIREVAQTLAERTRSTVVTTIGRKIVLYKRSHDPEKRIKLPK